MLWLTWRQYRWRLVVISILVAAYCAYLVIVGMVGRHTSGLVVDAPTDASPAAGNVANVLSQVLFIGNLLPLYVCAFIGAPLVAREFEDGTYRLIFTQSISRSRWLSVRFVALAIWVGFLGALIGICATWAGAPFKTLSSLRPFGNVELFDQSGFVPAFVWIGCLSLGMLAGILVRRSLPAALLAVVLAVVAFFGLAVARPHYIPPLQEELSAGEMLPDPPYDLSNVGWLYRISYVDGTGTRFTSRQAGEVCADPSNTYPTPECLRRTGLRQSVTYQPDSRYHWFEAIEVAIMIFLSVLTFVVCRYRIRRISG